MPHNLEENADGSYRFAYANEIPWHRLGQRMDGLQTAEAMLAAAHADYDVVLSKVCAVGNNGNVLYNPDGTPVIVEDSRATLRVNPDGTFDGLATVGTRFLPTQNREVLQRALDVVGASASSAVVDTCGVLDEGREFFASIDLGAVFVDPKGVNDKIERYLLVRNGHNGKVPITYANTGIRGVCKNTVTAGISTAQSIFTARHTRNQDSALEQAGEVLSLSKEWALRFQSRAETLLRIPVPAGSSQFQKVFDAVFPEKSGTDVARKNREDIQMTIRSLYGSRKNAAGFGYNGWSMYNAIGEYLDHHREAKPYDRAIASMDAHSWVARKKQTATEAILSLV